MDTPDRMPVDWQTVRKVLLIAKPDWKPLSGPEVENDDSRAYHFCQAVVEAYRAQLQVTCAGCGKRKDPYDFFRCWDCNAYLCRGCIRSHGVTNIPHPKRAEQYEQEISDLKAKIKKFDAEDEARADDDALWA